MDISSLVSRQDEELWNLLSDEKKGGIIELQQTEVVPFIAVVGPHPLMLDKSEEIGFFKKILEIGM